MIDNQEFELFKKYKSLISCDEVGLGALVGPVVSCAIQVNDLESLYELLLKPKRKVFEIGDSKQIPSYVREEFVESIKKVVDKISYGVVYIDEINSVKNIYKCGFIARFRAIQGLGLLENKGIVCIDGPFGGIGLDLPYISIVGGDKKFKTIGAASILSKVFRDKYMKKLHKCLPYYDWITNMGYGTKKHFEGLREVGPSVLHRFHVGGINKYFRDCKICNHKSGVFDGKGYKCLVCGG